MNIISLISSSNFIVVNKTLLKALGIEETILIGELASEYIYFANNNLLTEDGFFYSTVENIEEKTTLSDYQQRKALKHLAELNIVITEVRGLPAKRYIKINEEELSKLFDSPSSKKTKELEVKKLKTNNKSINKKETINTNTIINNSISNAKTHDTKKKNRYDQCIEAINEFTDDEELKQSLKLYLEFRLDCGYQNKENFYVGNWKGLLRKLERQFNPSEYLCVVNAALEHGWKSFYNPYNKKTTNYVDTAHTEKYTQEELDEIEKEGLNVKF